MTRDTRSFPFVVNKIASDAVAAEILLVELLSHRRLLHHNFLLGRDKLMLAMGEPAPDRVIAFSPFYPVFAKLRFKFDLGGFRLALGGLCVFRLVLLWLSVGEAGFGLLSTSSRLLLRSVLFEFSVSTNFSMVTFGFVLARARTNRRRWLRGFVQRLSDLIVKFFILVRFIFKLAFRKIWIRQTI